MSKEKSKISKITITIAGKEVVCTPEQIKDLKDALEEMYPAPTNIVEKHYYDWWHYAPKRYWSSPNVHYCSNKSNTVSLSAT